MEVHADVDGSGVPLAVLLKRELWNQKVERPDILFGEANKSKKGEDFTLLMPRCHRTTGGGGGENAGDDDAISVFAVMIQWPSSYFWPVFTAFISHVGKPCTVCRLIVAGNWVMWLDGLKVW
jgi:hypothetical protein